MLMLRPIWKERFMRFGRVVRRKPTAVVLILANFAPIVEIARRGEPIASILVIYWLQMMIIGFWTIPKLIVVSRWAALFWIPVFLIMYLSIVNIFGIMVGGLLDDQMRGTDWHDNFSLRNYLWVGAVLFLNHGISFVANFVRSREYKGLKSEDILGRPMLRAFPMWLATIFGAFIGAMLGSATVTALLVLPVKIALDVVGHLYEHDMLKESTS
jgi:hypothetical protein